MSILQTNQNQSKGIRIIQDIGGFLKYSLSIQRINFGTIFTSRVRAMPERDEIANSLEEESIRKQIIFEIIYILSNWATWSTYLKIQILLILSIRELIHISWTWVIKKTLFVGTKIMKLKFGTEKLWNVNQRDLRICATSFWDWVFCNDCIEDKIQEST